PNRRDDRLDNFRTPAFAEIGYTLDKRHQATPSILWLIVYKRRRRPWLARPALNVRLVGQSAKKVLIDHAPIISLMHRGILGRVNCIAPATITDFAQCRATFGTAHGTPHARYAEQMIFLGVDFHP